MAAFIEILEVPTAGRKGWIAASSSSERKLVRLTDAAIGCGLFVTNGATPGTTCKAPSTAAEARACLGCLIDPKFLNDVNAANDYLAGQQATLLESGYIWVETEGTVAVDDAVFVRYVSDGGSNTTLGKVRADNDTPVAGVVLTPTASPVQTTTGAYLVRLRDKAGNDETFVYSADGSATVGEIAAGLVALIDASPNFAATGTTTVTITAAAGGMVEVLQLGEHVTVTTPARAERLKGARFATAVSGAGLAKVKLQLRQDF